MVKIKIIPFITEVDNYKKVSSSRDIPYIFISRWSEEKGFNNLDTLIKKLQTKLVVCTYPIPENYNKSKKIIFKNGMIRDNILNYLLRSKVHISLSPKEGFSLVAYEAIKCGCVPISLAKTELSNYVEEYFHKKVESLDDLVFIAKTVK